MMMKQVSMHVTEALKTIAIMILFLSLGCGILQAGDAETATAVFFVG
jgi:hypothetical protein